MAPKKLVNAKGSERPTKPEAAKKFEPNFNFYGSELFYSDLKLLDAEKTKEKFIKIIERYIRTSPEYRSYIKYLKTEAFLNHCVFMNMLPEEVATKVSIEMHHCPLTLYDLVDIVLSKYLLLERPFTRLSIANEVMEAHFLNRVGIVPMTVTAHQMAHNNIMIINSEDVFGGYRQFQESYKNFLTEDHVYKINKIANAEKTYIENVRANCLEINQNLFIEEDDKDYDVVKLPSDKKKEKLSEEDQNESEEISEDILNELDSMNPEQENTTITSELEDEFT